MEGVPALKDVRQGPAGDACEIIENKRRGDVLAYIKERQEQQTKPDVKTNSEKNGYVRRARRPGRRKDFMNDPAVMACRKKALSRLEAAA